MAAAVELQGISKRFAGVQALDRVSFTTRAGEIHSVIGENGAGKSTLLRVLTGLVRPDGGSVRIRGEQVALRDPRDARSRGVSFVPQEVHVVRGLSAARNATLGLEPPLAPRLRLRKAERDRATTALTRAGAAFDVDRAASALSVPELRILPDRTGARRPRGCTAPRRADGRRLSARRRAPVGTPGGPARRGRGDRLREPPPRRGAARL